jgi:hypothetical protein
VRATTARSPSVGDAVAIGPFRYRLAAMRLAPRPGYVLRPLGRTDEGADRVIKQVDWTLEWNSRRARWDDGHVADPPPSAA